jgi:membrane-associated protease RseP (regulator of RpoE activity)
MGYLVVVLSLFTVIVLHELGHLIAGIITGAAIKSFNIGFGRRFLKLDIRGVEVNFRIFLVLGGFVQFKTIEECSETETPVEKLIYWKKIIVNLGGVFVNFLFAYLTLFGLSLTLGMGFLNAIQTSATLFITVIGASLLGIHKINEFVSPIGIIAQGGSILQTMPDKGYMGLLNSFLMVTTYLHLGVAVSNLLPISILDGGQCVVDTIKALSNQESIARKFLFVYEITSLFAVGLIFVFLVSKDTLAVIKSLFGF